mmetsp:Transcript_1809/g.3975  ORF Transcript_1809/g.3975 Transcript_1809/m.3975 type:complete len:223 (-) Transcript_1809:2266-2934(-)
MLGPKESAGDVASGEAVINRAPWRREEEFVRARSAMAMPSTQTGLLQEQSGRSLRSHASVWSEPRESATFHSQRLVHLESWRSLMGGSSDGTTSPNHQAKERSKSAGASMSRQIQGHGVVVEAVTSPFILLHPINRLVLHFSGKLAATPRRNITAPRSNIISWRILLAKARSSDIRAFHPQCSMTCLCISRGYRLRKLSIEKTNLQSIRQYIRKTTILHQHV